MRWFALARNVAWVLVVAAALAGVASGVGFLSLHWMNRQRVTSAYETGAITSIGGPFKLVNHRGETITERDFLGRPLLVFFGFTHCPDVCPTTLFEATQWLKELGRDGDRLQVLFVSVDPKRDTPEQLALYLQSFDPRIVAATGSKDEIDMMVRSYRAIYSYVPTGGRDYTVDHTANLFLIASDGRFSGTIDYHEDRKVALSKLKRLASN